LGGTGTSLLQLSWCCSRLRRPEDSSEEKTAGILSGSLNEVIRFHSSSTCFGKMKQRLLMVGPVGRYKSNLSQPVQWAGTIVEPSAQRAGNILDRLSKGQKQQKDDSNVSSFRSMEAQSERGQ
jgi:hypothetical protein